MDHSALPRGETQGRLSGERAGARLQGWRALAQRHAWRKKRAMSIPHCLVHGPKDTVGVVVVEGLEAGTDMLCLITENDTTFRLKAESAIPIGHKVALRDIKSGETIVKYGEDIGRAVADIRKGEHLHVHNVKTKRW
jgi:(2R)-sulfolactate sulfo-lyase subunit alpha